MTSQSHPRKKLSLRYSGQGGSFRTSRYWGLGGLAILAVSALSIPALADPPHDGMVVGIRGKILEIQPAYLRGHVRIVYDNKTEIVQEERLPLDKMPIGARILCWCSGSEKQGVTVHWITVGNINQFAAGKQVGIHREGDGAWYAGTLVKMRPVTVRDDAGTDIVSKIETKRVHYVHSGSPDDIMMGRKIEFSFDNANGGVYHATQISLSDAPGKAGIVYATVKAYRGGKLTVLPRFADKTMDIAVPPNTSIQRQISLPPESIKVGDRITAWGTPASFGPFKDLTAFSLMPGASVCPFASGSGQGGDRTITGTVTSMDPLIVKAGGRRLPIYVTGQTPYMRLLPASTKDLRPGVEVMLLLDHKLQSKYIMIDASPILAFGL